MANVNTFNYNFIISYSLNLNFISTKAYTVLKIQSKNPFEPISLVPAEDN